MTLNLATALLLSTKLSIPYPHKKSRHISSQYAKPPPTHDIPTTLVISLQTSTHDVSFSSVTDPSWPSQPSNRSVALTKQHQRVNRQYSTSILRSEYNRSLRPHVIPARRDAGDEQISYRLSGKALLPPSLVVRVLRNLTNPSPQFVRYKEEASAFFLGTRGMC